MKWTETFYMFTTKLGVKMYTTGVYIVQLTPNMNTMEDKHLHHCCPFNTPVFFSVVLWKFNWSKATLQY